MPTATAVNTEIPKGENRTRQFTQSSKTAEVSITKDQLDKLAKLQSKMKIVLLSDSMLSKIRTPEFQRALDTRRTPEIVRSITHGMFIPPVTLAEIDGDLFILDGQHRLEARKRVPFPLYAVIVPMNYKEATRNFVVSNTTQARVSLQHRLKVDTTEAVAEIRKIAVEIGCTSHQVYSVLAGLANTYSDILKHGLVHQKDMELAKKLLSVWSTDSRWGTGRKTVYDSPGILRTLGRFAGKAKDPIKMARKLQELDFSKVGTIGKHCGSSWTAQNTMREFIIEKLFVQGDLK